MTAEQRKRFKTLHPDAREVIILAQELLRRRGYMLEAEANMTEDRSDLEPWEVGDGGKKAFEQAAAQEEIAAKALNRALLRVFGCESSIPRTDLEALFYLPYEPT